MESNVFVSFIPLIILIVVFYFLVFRPQQQQKKHHIEMVTNLKKGDKIVTNGGFVCEVIRQEDKFITVRLGDNNVRLSKDYIAYHLDDMNDNTDKSLIDHRDSAKKNKEGGKTQQKNTSEKGSDSDTKDGKDKDGKNS